MTVEQGFNAFEAVLWMGLAAIIAAAAFRFGAGGSGRGRSTKLVAAGALVLFGVSDLIEVRTGAWWSPWWLLVMKGTCLAVLAGCGAWWMRRHVAARPPPDD